MKFLARFRRLFTRQRAFDIQACGAESGPSHEHIVIAKGGSTHTSVIGWTAYGKRNVPPGGYKPKTTIEFED